MGERCLGPLHVAIYTEIDRHTVIDRYIDSSYCSSCCCVDKTYCGVTSRYLAELNKYLGQGRKCFINGTLNTFSYGYMASDIIMVKDH